MIFLYTYVMLWKSYRTSKNVNTFLIKNIFFLNFEIVLNLFINLKCPLTVLNKVNDNCLMLKKKGDERSDKGIDFGELPSESFADIVP